MDFPFDGEVLDVSSAQYDGFIFDADAATGALGWAQLYPNTWFSVVTNIGVGPYSQPYATGLFQNQMYGRANAVCLRVCVCVCGARLWLAAFMHPILDSPPPKLFTNRTAGQYTLTTGNGLRSKSHVHACAFV